MHGLNGMGWGMGWWWFIGIIIFAAIVWMAIKAINNNKGGFNVPGKSALDILKERYAKGEIGKEEFEERMKNLM